MPRAIAVPSRRLAASGQIIRPARRLSAEARETKPADPSTVIKIMPAARITVTKTMVRKLAAKAVATAPLARPLRSKATAKARPT